MGVERGKKRVRNRGLSLEYGIIVCSKEVSFRSSERTESALQIAPCQFLAFLLILLFSLCFATIHRHP
jgi:hypothetical protein